MQRLDPTMLAEILSHYIEAALWSSTDESDESGGEPMDANYSSDDIAKGTRLDMERDIANFVAYVAITDKGAYDEIVERPDLAGHDFWLTRNGHGAGFWDGDWEHGDALTKASKTFGSVDLYIGDDGLVHAQ